MKNISSIFKGIIPFLVLQIALVIATSDRASAQLTVTIVGPTEICQGSTASLNVSTEDAIGDAENFTYTWTVLPPGNPTVIQLTYKYVAFINTSSAPGFYTIQCEVTDEDSNTATGQITIEILQSPDATITVGGPTTFCDGNSVLLSAVTDPTYSYQWRRGSSDIAAATSSDYSATVSGGYRVRVTSTVNGCSRTTKDPIDVTVNPLPSVTASNDGPVCYNGTINLTASPNGLVSYNWSSNSATPYASSDQNPSITNITPDYSGDYTVTVQDANGCVNTSVTSVLVYDDVLGGTIGTNQTVCYNGDPIAFTNDVSPSGGDGVWTYTWQYQIGAGPWTPIVGADQLTYDVSAGITQTTSYRRIASNGCSTANSNTITVTVYAQLNGGTVTADQEICYGEIPAAFTSTAAPSGGDGAWVYSWESKVGAGSWTPIASTNSLTYAVPAGLTETTMYRRAATNGCGTVYSNELTVTVNADLNGGTIGSDESVCYGGDPIAFTDDVSPSGGRGVWTYSWESKVGAGMWTPIAGTNSLTYDVPVGITETTMYRRGATNTCGTIYSNEITVTVYNQMLGGTIAGNQSLCYDSDPAAITSTVAPSGGNGPWTYAWEYQVNCAGPWNPIAGASGLTYDPPANQIETRCYRRVATNSCGTVYSNTVTITIYAMLDGGTVAANQTICYNGDPAAFSSIAAASGGNGAWTYAWQSKVGAGAWTPIAGATNSTYDVPAGITQTTMYRRVGTNSCGIAYSNELTVTVDDQILGGTIAADQSVCYAGDPAAFTNAVSPSGGTGAWTYSWESKTGAGAWTPIAATNSLTYDVPVGIIENTMYRRYASNLCGSAYSNELTITVYPEMNGGTIGSAQNVCFGGDPAAFTSSIAPSGGNGSWTYSWESRVGAGAWTPIAGTNSLTYNVPAGIAATTDYRRAATNSCGTVYSNTITVTVTPALNGNTIASNQLICSGSTPSLLDGAVPTGGSGAYTYQWQSSTVGSSGPFSNIGGATTEDYQPAALTQTTWYQRIVTSGPCTDISNVIEVTVNQPIANNTISAAQTICYNTAPGQLAGSVPTNGNGVYLYQWEMSTVGAAGPFAPIGGATLQNYQPGALTQNTWYRRLVTSAPCSDNISNVVMITVSSEITLAFTTTAPLCSGGATGTATVNPSGGILPYTYSWATTPVQTGQTATGLTPGTYTVTVSDNNLCAVSGDATVVDAIPVTFNPETVTDVTGCFGNTNGAISISVTGGTSPYTYTLYNNGAFVATQSQPLGTPANFTSLVASTQYVVEVVDANGCGPVASGVITVNQPALLEFTYTKVDLSCYGDNTGEIHFTATGGTPPYQYSINNGITWSGSPDFTGLSGANYSLRVRDANGCLTVRQLVKLNQPAQLFSDGGTWEDVTTCSGDNTGSITVVPGGGVPPYQYSINGGTTWQTSGIFPNLFAGTYTIIVEDASGCSINVGPITINEPDPIDIISIDITNVTTCWYNNNGEIFIWAMGGTGDLEFSIDGGINYQLDPLFENVTVGTYSIYVRDANGCGKYAGDYTVTGPPEIVVNTLNITNVTCSGAANGEIDATASGGTGALTYSIDGITYQGTGLFTGLTAGTYTLYVRDANGCILTQSVEITQPLPLFFDTQSATNITCFGLADGTITLTATGGTAPYEYSIDGGATFGNPSGIYSGLSAGNYNVAVRDASGCITNGSTLSIIEPAVISISSTSSQNRLCFGDTNGAITVEAIGGTGALTYTLINSSLVPIETNTTGIFTNVLPDTYTVNVDDENGCGPISTGPFTITEPAQLVIDSESSTDITCNNANDGTITIASLGGTAPITYNLYTGAGVLLLSQVDNGAFAGLAGGDYYVEVTDANGCGPVTSSTFTIVNPDALLINTETVTDITCAGLNDGTITVTITGGTTPFTYNLYNSVPALVASNGTGVFTGLSADSYTVEVVDGSGCPSVTSNVLTVSEPTTVLLTTNLTHISCNGQNDGEIEVVASGGNPPYTFTLYDNAMNLLATNTVGVFAGLSGGDYSVEVNDGNACGVVSTGIVTINEPAVLTITTFETDLTCNGDASGSILVIAGGGTAPYEYSFDNGVTFGPSNNATGLNGGDYNVVVRDANGCEAFAVVNIFEPDPLTLSLTGFDLSCAGAIPADGRIIATSTGGTSSSTTPKLFRLDGGFWQTSGIFNGVAAGLHTVEVVDANSCLESASITINEPLPISIASVTSTDPTCNTFGTITVVATGGTGTLTYTLIPGGATSTDGTFTGLGEGTYTVEVTDQNGCGPETSAPITISSPSTITITSVDIVDATGCFGDSNGQITINATGGTGALRYSIDGGLNYVATNVFTGLAGGNYTVVVNDDADCPQTQLVAVGQPAELVVDNVFFSHVTAPGADDGVIIVVASGGTGTLTYNLYNTLTVLVSSNTVGEFNNLQAGTYYVQVVDDNGCTVTTANIALSQIELVLIPTHISCNGADDGRIDLTINGGTAPYTIRWEGPSGTLPAFDDQYAATGLAPGIYTVTVTDNIGAVAQNSVTIDEPAAITFDVLDVTIPSCNGVSDATINAVALGGNGGYTYELLDINGLLVSQNGIGLFTALPSGFYTLNVTDALGCSTSTTVIVDDPEPLTIVNADVIHPTTPAASDGSITVTALGGSGLLTYDLFNAANVLQASNTTGIFTGLSAGVYYVVVTDVNGCNATSENITLSGMSINVDVTDVSCNGGSDGGLNIVIAGATPPVQITLYYIDEAVEIVGYDYNNAARTLKAGQYLITVTDASGKVVTQQVEITQPQPLVVALGAITEPQCAGFAGDGTVEFIITGGTAPYTITWDNGTYSSVGTIATGVIGGTHNFVITDANGCTAEVLDVYIAEPTPIVFQNITMFNPPCNGDATGIVEVVVTGGTGTLTYNLVNGATNETNNTGLFINLTAGAYTLTVTDGNGCSVSPDERITLTEPTPLQIAFSRNIGEFSDSVKCPYDKTAYVTALPSGGTPDYSYYWSNGEASHSIANLGKGDYVFFLRDANGCFIKDTFTVKGPADFDIDMVLDLPLCKEWDPKVDEAFIRSNLGTISINNVTGSYVAGSDSLLYTLKYHRGFDYETIASSWQKEPATVYVKDSIVEGNYLLVVQDSAGCEYNNEFYVGYSSKVDFTAGDPVANHCYAAALTLDPEWLGTLQPNDTTIWSSSTYVNRNGTPWVVYQDLFPEVYPTETGYFVLTLRSEYNPAYGNVCIDRDSVEVSVRPKIGVYVPGSVSIVQDSIINILAKTHYPIEVNSMSTDKIIYTWKPDTLFKVNPDLIIMTLAELGVDPSEIGIDPLDLAVVSPNFFGVDNALIYVEDKAGLRNALGTSGITEFNDKGKRDYYFNTYIIGTDTVGCTDTLKLYTLVVDKIRIPNVFTPNGDGKNDTWIVPREYLFPNMEVEVFNRWGSPVWVGSGDDLAKGWDGRTKGGNELPVGTYYYVIKYNAPSESGKWDPITGSITIIR